MQARWAEEASLKKNKKNLLKILLFKNCWLVVYLGYSVQRGKTKHKIAFFFLFIKQWFAQQTVALSLNKCINN